MDANHINDVRVSFRNITFSKFQKSKARLELLRNLGVISSDLQPFSKRIKTKNGNIDKFLIIEL